jgi:hypothetical protein
LGFVQTPEREYVQTEVPDLSHADLGQKNCLRCFESELEKNQAALNHKKYILLGQSQGTATITKWVAQLSPKEQNEKVGCMVLEGVLGSGNSAIMHVAERMDYLKALTYMPFSRLWVPWVGKAAFMRSYNPWGKQPLSSAKKISPDIPVVIMHAPNDPQLSINDARKLYCTLKQNGNKNVYLFEIDTPKEEHTDLLSKIKDKDKKDTIMRTVQAIYKKHKLPNNFMPPHEVINPNPVNFRELQPSVQEVRQRIKNQDWKKRYVRNTVDILSAGLALGYLYSKFAKK